MCATAECSDCVALADFDGVPVAMDSEETTPLPYEPILTPEQRGRLEAERAAAHSRHAAAVLNAALMDDVSAGLRVLVTRDGVPLTEAAIRERAANIVSGLVGSYHIEQLVGIHFETAEQHAARIIR